MLSRHSCIASMTSQEAQNATERKFKGKKVEGGGRLIGVALGWFPVY